MTQNIKNLLSFVMKPERFYERTIAASVILISCYSRHKRLSTSEVSIYFMCGNTQFMDPRPTTSPVFQDSVDLCGDRASVITTENKVSRNCQAYSAKLCSRTQEASVGMETEEWMGRRG